MDNEKIIEDINSGKKKLMGKWEYVINSWSPIITLIGFLVAGILWFANAEGRLFTNANMKVKTEEHVTNANEPNGEEYVTKAEFERRMTIYLELARENRADIKEILKYLRK